MRTYIVILLMLVLTSCTSKECVVNKYPYDADYQYSASVVYNYMDYYLKGNELVKSVNDNKGILSIATVNPDNTPNTSFFSMVMLDTSYAIATFNSDNQTSINLRYIPQAMITYTEYRNDQNGILNYVGARIIVDCLVYEDDISKVEMNYRITLRENQYLLKIVEIRPLG